MPAVPQPAGPGGRPPCCRAAGTWPTGSRAAGTYLQKNYDKKLQTGPWGLAIRQLGGRPYFLQFSPFREIISHLCFFCNFLQK